MRKRALVLSGGGGRGAYHIGVLEALVKRGWMEDGVGPDIIAGTSIGAINAAAIASGMKIAELRERWLAMRSEHVHRLSEDLPVASRPFLRLTLGSILTSEGHEAALRQLIPDDERDMSAERFIDRLQHLFHARPFRSLLDTTPWRYTLREWMDFDRINSDDAPGLLLAATDVQSGALRIFSNRDRARHRRDVITMDHLMASSSIPLIYPWTSIDQAQYWDGAVVANTPLGPVIDLAGDDDVDILVVLMTPWHERPDATDQPHNDLPKDMVQALALTLDWALLASYRVALKALRRGNQLADAAAKLHDLAHRTGDETLRMIGDLPRYISEPTMIAPEKPMSSEWIVDYEVANHEKLFELGYQDALHALDQRELKQLLNIDNLEKPSGKRQTEHTPKS